MKIFKSLFISCLFLISVNIFASRYINTSDFRNSGILESINTLQIKARNSFVNTGMLKAPAIIVDAPTISGPTDTKLGKICFTQSFILNGVSVPLSYSRCN